MKHMLKFSPDPWINAIDLPPVLIECLFARVSPDCYIGPIECRWCSFLTVIEALDLDFKNCRAKDFLELSGMRKLFDSSQTWKYERVARVFDNLHQRLEARDASLLGLSTA